MFDCLLIFHALYSRCRMAHFSNILPTGCKLRTAWGAARAAPWRLRPPRSLSGEGPTLMLHAARGHSIRAGETRRRAWGGRTPRRGIRRPRKRFKNVRGRAPSEPKPHVQVEGGGVSALSRRPPFSLFPSRRRLLACLPPPPPLHTLAAPGCREAQGFSEDVSRGKSSYRSFTRTLTKWAGERRRRRRRGAKSGVATTGSREAFQSLGRTKT